MHRHLFHHRQRAGVEHHHGGGQLVVTVVVHVEARHQGEGGGSGSFDVNAEAVLDGLRLRDTRRPGVKLIYTHLANLRDLLKPHTKVE
ncbi:hypothetical protein GCM10012289_64800 [Nonomuraea cavernae]|uniref:Uncharacterized protein n=1 Tax=Nonomuraea cavernae TaxID=2045107 RepID=A0A917ZBW5_9ACTN|nr:hypothetical protein GCM10012289_64800 [Nonomuraea cavernae]